MRYYCGSETETETYHAGPLKNHNKFVSLRSESSNAYVTRELEIILYYYPCTLLFYYYYYYYGR